MDESNQRIEKLRDQLKNANQKILVFEAQSGIDSRDAKDSQDTLLQQLKQALEQNERKGMSADWHHVCAVCLTDSAFDFQLPNWTRHTSASRSMPVKSASWRLRWAPVTRN